MGLKDIFKGNNVADVVGSIIEKGTGLIDEVVTNKEEAAKVKTEFTKVVQDHQIKINEEITKRHQADMNSDSWMSKNIRPMTLIFVLGLYSAFAILDGNVGEFNISDAYVSLLGQWGMLIMSFYFGGRTVEKIGNLLKK
jgi:hypothetical protein